MNKVNDRNVGLLVARSAKANVYFRNISDQKMPSKSTVAKDSSVATVSLTS
ncbi:MAG: hypothetical protein HRT53_17555 [Colwellia sp.]|nr:hypothetical protein [Colwellia sp.]